MPPSPTVDSSLIEGTQRDNTEDWIVPRAAVPTIAELEARIDEALVIARASEEGVREVGEMAIDAARQARRAAEAAEEAVRAASQAPAAGDEGFGPAPPTGRDVVGPSEVGAEGEPSEGPPVQFEVRFRRFSERADRLSGRLRRLGAPQGGSSVAGGRRRGDG